MCLDFFFIKKKFYLKKLCFLIEDGFNWLFVDLLVFIGNLLCFY